MHILIIVILLLLFVRVQSTLLYTVDGHFYDQQQKQQHYQFFQFSNNLRLSYSQLAELFYC